jgi:hypothetical protein
MCIETFYPFDLKNLISIDEYLFIIKNCFRLIKKNGIRNKIDGFYVFINWSLDKQNWLIESTSNISDEDKKIVIEIIKSESIESFFETYKMKQNANRRFVFIFKEKYIYPVGLYSNLNSKSSYKVINNSNHIINTLSNLDSRIKNTKLQFQISNYFNTYNDFIKKLNCISIKFEDNIEINLSSYLNLKKCSKQKRITFKSYNVLINEKIFPSNQDLFYFIVYFITIELGKYLNELIYKDNICYNDFIITDNVQQTTIKVPSKFYYEYKKKDKVLLPPLLPSRF